MSSSRSGSSGPVRVVAWAAAAAVAVLFLGKSVLAVFRPPPDAHLDFVQEWLSARNFRAGDPAYLPERESLVRRTGIDRPELAAERPWNAHPPVAVLAALPVGLIPDYGTAHLAWNLATFAVFLAAVGLILRELRVPLRPWSVFPAVLFVVADYPVLSHLAQGQLNFLVLFLLTLGWAADRRGYGLGAGVAVGLAAGLKLFPGLVLVYFVARRAWRQALATVLAAATVNAVALGVFGAEAFRTYVRDVLPSLDVFRGAWANVSATGYATRVCAAAGVPGVGPVLAGVLQAAVVGTIAVIGWRSRATNDRDRGFTLAVAGMPLASPVAWSHYFVILALPLLVLWQRLPNGWPRAVFWAAVVLLLIPDGLYPGLYERVVPGSPDVATLANHRPTPRDFGLCAIGLGVPTLALTAVFLLLALARLDPPRPDRPGGDR